MGFLANLRLRRKFLVAMAPLALMVVAAGVYSSVESKRIDTWYSELIDNQMKALRYVDEARAQSNRFRLLLYELLDETDPDRKQAINGELEKILADYHTVMMTALKLSPERANKIRAASAVFDQAEADARPGARSGTPSKAGAFRSFALTIALDTSSSASHPMRLMISI